MSETMPRTPARRLVERAQSEAAFRQQIEELARATGWLVFHDPDAGRCRNCGSIYLDKRDRGFPDLVLAKPYMPVLFLETKSERGWVEPEQRRWIEALKLARGVEADFAKPRHWDQIEAVLKAR